MILKKKLTNLTNYLTHPYQAKIEYKEKFAECKVYRNDESDCVIFTFNHTEPHTKALTEREFIFQLGVSQGILCAENEFSDIVAKSE